MKQKKLFIVLGVLVVITILWAIFRPEKAFIDMKVNEALPGTMNNMSQNNMEMKVLAKGMFHSGAHDTAGMATIYQLADGKRVLRLSDFSTSNGPDVKVLLVMADDVMKNSDVTMNNYIQLGDLKGNKGNQNYEIPADVDLSKYHTVTIWCKQFSVNFGSAPLKP